MAGSRSERRNYRSDRSRSPHRSHRNSQSSYSSKTSVKSSRERPRENKKSNGSRLERTFPKISADIPEPAKELENSVVVDENTEIDIEEIMQKELGFSKFSSTKNQKVEGNDILVVKTVKRNTFRQYMNRKGGFNRPLDPVAK
ncbi:MAG: hypothetical protein MHMPM18_002267 [Marteilia pararefringens]